MAFYELTGRKFKATVEKLFEDCMVSVYCGKGVHVEGHRGIVLFSDNEIVFKRKKDVITIYGNELKICEVTQTDAFVVGNVKGVLLGHKNG